MKLRKADITFIDLCDEIDELKAEVKYWKGLYKEQRDENIRELKERNESNMKDLANVLLFAFSTRDDENGNLVIDKDDRKMIAENWKK